MKIYVNQLGYLLHGRKTAAAVSAQGAHGDRLQIRIFRDDGALVLQKESEEKIWDALSGEWVWRIDFSKLTREGVYRIECGGVCSDDFRIGRELYRELTGLLCKSYYYQRCGMKLEKACAGVFCRESCHEETAVLLKDYENGQAEGGRRFEVSGGWHDAGDYGRYTTAGAVAAAQLLYAWKWFPESFRDSLQIPESGGCMDDILYECLYELKWLLKLQMTDGSVCHKLTSMRHANFVMPSEDRRQMILFPPSTMAAGAFAAVMALAFRVYREKEPEFAGEALAAAKRAWEWLENHPALIGFENPPGCNTGEYGDDHDRDERFWAAAELYRSTGEERYLRAAGCLFEGIGDAERTRLGWRDTAGLGGFAFLDAVLAARGENAEAQRAPEGEISLRTAYEALFLQEAEQILRMCEANAYRIAMQKGDFVWGSNMVLMQRAMTMLVAGMLSGREAFFDGALQQMDYLLGMNAVGASYVTSVGGRAVKNIHNRAAVADGIEACIPGLVSGGANTGCQDEKAEWLIGEETPPMKCYADEWECYSLNENAVYWNSPAVFAAAGLYDRFRKEDGKEE